MLHVPSGHDVVARVAQARLFMNFLDENVPQSSPYHSVYKSWKQKFAQLPDDYIAHEFLEGVNEPSTFRDFLAAGEKHGLAYLAEVELASMILDNHPAKLAKSVQTLASNQLVATEQYLDMLTARTFRQSLLVSAERQAGINRNLKPERFADLHFIGGADLNFATDVKGGGVLSDASGRSATVTTQALGDALAQLVARFPASSSVETLFRALSASNRTDAVRQSLLDALYKMSISGLIRVSTEPVGAASLVRDRPIAWPLARKDAANGHLATVNLRHERVDIDILGQHILPLLDGTRNMQAVAAEVISAARQGRLNFARDGIPIKDETALRQAVDAQVAAVLASFARAALLTG